MKRTKGGLYNSTRVVVKKIFARYMKGWLEIWLGLEELTLGILINFAGGQIASCCLN